MAITPAHRVVELLGPWRRGGTSRGRLAASLRSLVLDGRLAVETRLPAERALAAALGVSHATVTGAYDQLRRYGVAHRLGDPGRGARVVTETEIQISGLRRRSSATTVLFPTPEGPESTVSREFFRSAGKRTPFGAAFSAAAVSRGLLVGAPAMPSHP